MNQRKALSSLEGTFISTTMQGRKRETPQEGDTGKCVEVSGRMVTFCWGFSRNNE